MEGGRTPLSYGSIQSAGANLLRGRRDPEDMNQLITGERGLLRSLSGLPNDDTTDDTAGLIREEENNEGRTLGTLKGVFAPVSLSMFSALLFLRVGYIVGNAGFLQTVLLFVIAYTILVSTVFSICAIATNGAVKGGGLYFMLSRTMGPEFGGSIGVLFYFANVVCSALYITACTEGLVSNFGPKGAFMQVLPIGKWYEIFYSSCFNIMNMIFCLIGAELFGKASILVLAIVTICGGGVGTSFFLDTTYSTNFTEQHNETVNGTIIMNNITVVGEFIGITANSMEGLQEMLVSNLYSNYQMDCQSTDGKSTSFFEVFGVLFSGVTGIMAGANLSGELISPGKSIPLGTISSCIFTFTTFIILSLLTAMTCNLPLLHHDCMYMIQFTFWKGFVLVGVILATWSASLSNLIGGSRVLQAVAKDTMFGPFLKFITRGTVGTNPISAVVSTFVFVQVCFFLGGLNQIAQLCSVLFLLSYASVNLACLGLDLASAPNFRPSFKYFCWPTSLVGLIGTSVMMFLISPLFSALSILLCLSLVIVLNFFSPVRHENWGSISQALIFHQVRKYLLLLDPRKTHIKFWRPQMLLMVRTPRSSCALIDFVNSMKKGGLYVIGHVKLGELAKEEVDPCGEDYSRWLSLVDHLKVKAFVELTLTDSVRSGTEQLVRVAGIGAMKPNTIILGFRDNTGHSDDLSESASAYFSTDLDGSFMAVGDRTVDKDIHENEAVEDFASVKKDERISEEEYVGIILDTLKLEKNIVLCRNFQELDRKETHQSELRFRVRAGKKKYLDVWPCNFFSDKETDVEDTTSLFLIQLATIVHAVPKWKKHTLRVFMCVREEENNLEQKKAELKKTLDLLRIPAERVVLDRPELASISRDGNNDGLTEDLTNVTADYLLHANNFIRKQCDETAVSFIYLPRPPTSPAHHKRYLSCLESLTENLPPTLLVHGVSPVMTTTL